MLSYLARRVAMAALVVAVAISVNFLIPQLMPGDAVEQQLAQLSAAGGQVGNVQEAAAALRALFGLDRPLWQQYLDYVGRALTLDLGVSIANYPERVAASVRAALPWTVGLLGTATLLAFALGTLLGGLMAWPAAPRWLKLVAIPLVTLSAVPYFMLGVVLLAVFGLWLQWFPVAGGYAFDHVPEWSFATARLVAWHAVLPAASIVLASIGTWAMTMRGMTVSVLGEDHIMLAEAKGLPARRVFLAYGLRNALLPQFTQLALKLGHVVSGAILVEVIFAYPGVGYRLYLAIGQKDVFVIQGIVLILSISIALAMLTLDLLYPLIDPRVAARRS